MRFIIETITGRKGIKSFNDLNEYVDFMTTNGDKIKNIMEAELPYGDKPVKLTQTSGAQSWEQVKTSEYNDLNKSEKGDCLLPSGNDSVFKNASKFEPSKCSEKEDTCEQPKVEKTPINSSNNSDSEETPKFEYKEETSEPKQEETSEPKQEETSKPKKEKKEEVNEGVLDTISSKYNEMRGAPKESEIPEYVNEFLVYTFMDIFNLTKAHENQTYLRIVKALTKADKRFEKFVEAVRVFVANYSAFHRGIDVANELKRRLIKQGVSEEIVNKAWQTFQEEEMKPRYDNSDNQDLDDSAFDDEINEALKNAGIEIDESCDESTGEEEDGELDKKTGKEKLFEEEPESSEEDFN